MSKTDRNVINEPPMKKKKIILKPRHSLFKAQESNETGSLENNSTNRVDEKLVKTNVGTNVQHFVLLLKEKLEKSSLKKLISEIKAYKEQGLINPLLNLL